ncbi:MFS transporter [Nibricoccus sp. IMCC34717]|uniref:MFS transporter n=1 Tax=Nibricoccus sp. IMCC34717 TaxID=3034021 RepID=UPI00384C8DA0
MAASTPAPANVPASSTKPEDKVKVIDKIVYGSGTCIDMWGHWLYPTLSSAVFNIFLGLSPSLVGLANTLIRFVDLFSDPFAGWLSDKTRTKYGRRRPFILLAGIVAGLGLPLLFFVPQTWIASQFLGLPALFWFMLLTNLVYIPLVSLVNMPYHSLGAELTPDYNERTSVMAFKSVIQKIFEVGNFAATAFLTLEWFRDDSTGKMDTLRAAQTYCAILGGIMVIAAVTIFLRMRERYYATVSEKAVVKESLWASFTQNLKCKPFRFLLMNGIFFILGTSMVQSLGYYCTIYYVCGADTISGNRWNSLMGVSYMVGGTLGAPLFSLIGRLTDKKTGILAASIAGILAFGGTWFTYNPAFPSLQLFASGSIGFAMAGFWMLNSSMLADVMDYDESTTGRRREGALNSTNSWIMKAGNGLGAYASGLILESTGFLASRGVQSPETLMTIRVALALVPIAGIAVSTWFIFRYPLSKYVMADLRTELEKRRGTV